MTITDDTRERSGGKARKPAETHLVPLLDVHEVAQWLSVGERHVRRLVFERRIPYVKWGRLVRFDPVELSAWLDGQRSDTAPRLDVSLPRKSFRPLVAGARRRMR